MAQQFGKDVAFDGVRGHGENLVLGLLAGLVAAGVGALIWMAVAVSLGAHLRFIALGVGAMVGLAVRFAGNGRSLLYGIIGALLTLAGCLGGDVLATVQSLVTPEHDFYHTLTTVDLIQLVLNILHKMDAIAYLIYGIGMFEAYMFSIRK